MTNSISLLIALILFLAAPLVSLAADPVHLFLLSGQSNMANLKPEQVFSPEIQKHFGAENVVIVKVAQKGEPIRRWDKNWKVTGDQHPAEIGDIYRQLIEEAEKALDGRPIKSVTLIWMQGERDAKERLSAHYEEAFLGMVEQIKTDFDVDEINCIIGRLSDSGSGKKDWDHIRRVQEKLGESGRRSAWINTDDLNDDNVGRDGTPLKPNDLHYSEKGYRLLAERFARKAIELLSNAEQTTKAGR
ncbi:sialate O-acetylesterase [Neorhodopirellula pilleata]|uniref:Sialate O-acetylesterase domain-containing protein n=1 Tax=Neorhodopirellula pilleata TaxID=2714738 RepID=A0A5C6ADK4_9BACT|nr:sialate O-acetylesterase [Neorhodopirellula pilleata]TWT97378.1 hypothetical protein Pla100_25300 [Neorhodopirellula pilleata]